MANAFWRKAVDVRDDEAGAVVGSFGYFFCVLSSFYVLRPLREEMGVAGGLSKLPWLFTGTFLATLAVVPLWGTLAARFPRRQLVPIAYRFFSLTMVVLYALLNVPSAVAYARPAVFIWISVFNLFVVSIFWSLMADLYRPEQGRRLFGFISAGGTAGAIAGPLLATALAPRIGPAHLLLVSAAFLELCTQCGRRLVRADQGNGGEQTPAPARSSAANAADASSAANAADASSAKDRPLGGGVLAGIPQVLRSGYLLALSAHVLLFTLTATILYFQQAGITSRLITSPGLRTAYFAKIDLAVNVLSLLLQAAGTGRVMKRAGVGVTLGAVAVITLGAFGGLAASPGLGVLLVAMTARRAAGYALERPAREVLFTVVRREEKYKAKSVIDTLVYRGGDAASAWLQAALSAGGVGMSAMVVLSLPITAVWLLIVYFLGRRQETLAAQGQTLGLAEGR